MLRSQLVSLVVVAFVDAVLLLDLEGADRPDDRGDRRQRPDPRAWGTNPIGRELAGRNPLYDGAGSERDQNPDELHTVSLARDDDIASSVEPEVMV
jgi:hypothetical protein